MNEQNWCEFCKQTTKHYVYEVGAFIKANCVRCHKITKKMAKEELEKVNAKKS